MQPTDYVGPSRSGNRRKLPSGAASRSAVPVHQRRQAAHGRECEEDEPHATGRRLVSPSQNSHVARTGATQAKHHPRSAHRPSRAGRANTAATGTHRASIATQSPWRPHPRSLAYVSNASGRRVSAPATASPTTHHEAQSERDRGSEPQVGLTPGSGEGETACHEQDDRGDETHPEAHLHTLELAFVERVHHVEDHDCADDRRSDECTQPLDPPPGTKGQAPQSEDDQTEVQQVDGLDSVALVGRAVPLLWQQDAQQHEPSGDQRGDAAQLPVLPGRGSESGGRTGFGRLLLTGGLALGRLLPVSGGCDLGRLRVHRASGSGGVASQWHGR